MSPQPLAHEAGLADTAPAEQHEQAARGGRGIQLGQLALTVDEQVHGGNLP
jgi:hypothetical protein